VYSHLLSPLFCSLWISSTATQCQTTWRTTSVDLTISRRLSPSRCPCGALLFMYSFYASALLEPSLDSVVIKIFIYNLYAFISWYVLWYLDDSVVYMRDLILAHIWLLGLCLYKSGVTATTLEVVKIAPHVRPSNKLDRIRSSGSNLLGKKRNHHRNDCHAPGKKSKLPRV
jgi:hypothetical protein